MPARRRPRQSGESENRAPVEPGQLLRQRAMGTNALYRVVERVEHGVRVEVVEAPGLEAGARFVFSEESVAAMEVLYGPPERAPSPAPSNSIRHRLA